MTRTARADGRRRLTGPRAAVSSLRISLERVLLPPPKTDCNESVLHAARASTASMPIHDPATLEKFRQAATACRISRSGQRPKSRSISDATATVATGNGGVGRCAAGQESAALVPLSPSSFGRQATSPTTAESQMFLQHGVDKEYAVVPDDEKKNADDCEKSRRGRGRRRTLAVVSTARFFHQLLPSKTGDSRAAATSKCAERPPLSPLSPPAFALTSDDESATSDAETNLLRRVSDRRGAATAREGDVGGDQRLSRDTFYSSTATDRFRLSTGSDSAGARRLSSGDESYSPPDVFHVGDHSDASESRTVTDQSGHRRSSSETDAVRAVAATTKNDASTPDKDDVNRVFDADSSPLRPKTRSTLRFALLTWLNLSFVFFFKFLFSFIFPVQFGISK